ncbi:MAG: NAD(P)-binding protein, partial [Deltaproteobacteria bacterium]|nr:NAD(P)-binding protein [Deltaproteobacteria bacterium]
MFWQIIPPMGTPLAANTPFAAAIKEVVDVPVIAVGRIHSPGLAEHIVEKGQADMVAMGRPLLADPEFVNKARQGRFDDITPCISCGIGCIQKRQEMIGMTCLMNPNTGKESEPIPDLPQTIKSVMIVGGGPAGLTAARIASERGHRVILYEKTDKLGG